jgi:hypothetical protein
MMTIKEIAEREKKRGMASIKKNQVKTREEIADYSAMIDAIIVLNAEKLPDRNLAAYRNDAEGLLESLALEICEGRGKYIQAILEIATDLAEGVQE